MKRWYRVVDEPSPNVNYRIQTVRIHPGEKSLPSVLAKVSNGRIFRVKNVAFRSIHTVEDIAWIVKVQGAFVEWLELVAPIKKMLTIEELEKYLSEKGFERRN